MDAAALPAPRNLAATGVLHLHLELCWRDTVLVARSFTHGVWSGPTKHHPFPMEGFDCDPKGFVLASRDGDSYFLTPPKGASPARPMRLVEGQSCSYAHGELTLRARVTREQQVTTLDWLWPVCAPFAFLLAWRMVEWFGILFAFILMLVPKAHPPVIAAPPDTSLRLVKVLPMVYEVKPAPLPEKPRDRLAMLMAGKRTDEIFKDSSKRAAQAQQKKAALKTLEARGTLKMLAVLTAHDDVAQFGMIGLITAKNDSAVLGAADFGPGGFGQGAVIGGLVGTGTGLGTLGAASHAPNAAEDAARAKAKTSGQSCWNEADADDESVLMRIAISPDGTVTPHAVAVDAPGRVVACLEKELRGWKLPATEHGGRVTVRFRFRG